MLESARELRRFYDIRVAHGPDVGSEGSIEAEVAAEFPVHKLPRLRRSLRPIDDIRVVADLRRLYGRLGPDLIHTHSSKAGIAGRLAAGAPASGVIHTVHGWGHTPADPGWYRRLLVEAERRVARRADILIAVSADVRDEGLELRIGRPDQYRVIPEHVTFAPSHPGFDQGRRLARSRLRVPVDAPVVGWVGRFMPQKDPRTLALALKELLASEPQMHAVLIGDGELRSQVEDALAFAGRRVHFAGFRKDVRELYAAFDVLVHTSLWEGQPRVIQECIAERVPAVTARVAGTPQLMASGRVGQEVEPGDHQGFATAVRRILESPELRAPLDEAAVQAVAASNGRQASLEGHLEVYREVLATVRDRVSSSGSC